jgi:hypothetical protein
MKLTKTFRVVAIAALTGLAASSAQAAILNVCQSGCQYSLPSQAYSAAVAGDTIQIQPGTYTDCIYIQKSNLTITGVNGMPKMVNKVCGQKGILVTAAQNLTIKNLELSGATDNENYAGIRHDAAGFNLTLDNVYIHDNDDGILSSSSGDNIVISNSRFERNGMNNSTGMAHNLYIGNAASVKFTNSRSTAAKLGGHEFKTRAARTEILNSTLATLGGADSRLIDVSNGGILIVQDSVLEKSPGSSNNDMIAYGPEGLTAGRTYSVTLTGNKVIGDRSPSDLIYFFKNANSITISSNTLVAIRTVSNLGTPTGNTAFASRTAAGYAAYPWLPTPTTAAPTPTTTTWTHCANENGTCTFTGTRTVRYGANGIYVTAVATGSIVCSNTAFGKDPVYGAAKTCDYSSDTVSTTAWLDCAPEGSICSVNGTRNVRYGANGSYFTKSVAGSIACTNTAFGGDPAYGYVKKCQYAETAN